MANGSCSRTSGTWINDPCRACCRRSPAPAPGYAGSIASRRARAGLPDAVHRSASCHRSMIGSDQLQPQYDRLTRFRQFWALIVTGFLVAAAICVVLARSGAAAPPSSFTYMPLGDSITQSYSASRGYRCPLQARLVEAGYKASAVGRSGYLDHGFLGGLLIRYFGWTIGGDCPDTWEGHGSHTTAQIQAWFDADNSIKQLKPNIILALVGNKDVRSGNGVPTTCAIC